MWITSKVFSLFEISKETVSGLREELAATKAERDSLKTQLITSNANFSWITTRVNALEIERAQLLRTKFDVTVPIPQILSQMKPAPSMFNPDIFNDMGDEEAKKLNLPVYDSN